MVDVLWRVSSICTNPKVLLILLPLSHVNTSARLITSDDTYTLHTVLLLGVRIPDCMIECRKLLVELGLKSHEAVEVVGEGFRDMSPMSKGSLLLTVGNATRYTPVSEPQYNAMVSVPSLSIPHT
jgi:hypothetical protein